MRSVISATARMRTVVLVVIGVAILSGCEKPHSRLNAPPQGQTDRPSELQDNYARMVDNTLLSERSISPVHFVSGTTELNALGVRRLNRYATLLKIYGGALHYDGVADAEELAKQRVDRLKDYLVAAGVGPDLFSVDVGVAGGSDLRAGEASLVRSGTTVIHTPAESLSIDKSRKDIIEDGNIPVK